jgi:hypothetical protein
MPLGALIGFFAGTRRFAWPSGSATIAETSLEKYGVSQ